MELGTGMLRRNGINNLHNALHQQHGLLWTDGKGIYLAPVHLNPDQKLDSASSLRLGEFQDVHSVHWSCPEEGGEGSCFMATVHQTSVSVWHVSGTAPRLAFKQVRKISVQLLAQGCLWNPRSDVLCLLSWQQCSFYFRHTHNRGSFAFPSLENGKISCGCWSPDGKSLVLCVGSALLIYTWADIEANISDFVTAAWRVPGVIGNITAVVSSSDSSVLCASDLPLHLLCASKNDHDTLVCPGTEGATTVRGSVLNMQPAEKRSVQDAALLTMVQFRSGVHDPQVVTSTVIPAILSPDLLYFQMESQCIVVGSNTQTGLQVFTYIEGQLVLASHLNLEKEERPKGVCGMPVSQTQGTCAGVLVLIGRTEPIDSTFPSISNTQLFSLSLRFFPVRPDKARQLMNGLVRSTKTTSSSFSVKQPNTQHHEPLAKSVSDSRQLSTSSELLSQSQKKPRQEERGDNSSIKLSVGTGQFGSRLVEDITDFRSGRVVEVVGSGRQATPTHELETQTSDFFQSQPKFNNSALARKYEMNWTEDELERNKCEVSSKSASSQAQKGESMPTGKRETILAQRGESVQNLRGESSVQAGKRENIQAKKGDNISAQRGESIPSPREESIPAHGVQTSLQAQRGESIQSLRGAQKGAGVENRREEASGHGHRGEKGGSSTLTNGHGCSDKVAPQFFLSQSSLDDGSVQSSPVSDRHTSSPSLTGGEKGSGGDRASICSSINSSDNNYDTLERQIMQQREQINELQKKLTDLAMIVEDSCCVFPQRYQPMTQTESLTIQCVVGGKRVSRRFLLDNGRLQLDPVKQAFSLLTVELILDGEPLVLGSNIDGYIPMRFSPNSQLQITGIPVACAKLLRARANSKEAI